MRKVTTAETEVSPTDLPESLSGYHRRTEGFLHDLLVIVSQVQDSSSVADWERAEENEGGGVHLGIEDVLLTGEQWQALEIALRCFRAAASARGADTGRAKTFRLGSKWLANGQITHKEMAELSASIQNLQTLYRLH